MMTEWMGDRNIVAPFCIGQYTFFHTACLFAKDPLCRICERANDGLVIFFLVSGKFLVFANCFVEVLFLTSGVEGRLSLLVNVGEW